MPGTDADTLDLTVMDEAHSENWSIWNGDSAEVLPHLPDHSIDLSVFSPPFSSTDRHGTSKGRDR